MAEKRNTYRERSGNTVGDMTPEEIFANPEGAALAKKDIERLKKTRPDWKAGGKHTQESIMRGIEEGEVAEKGMVGRALNRLKTNVMGSAVDNELAGESLKRAGYKAGGKVKSASSRADGCAIRGKTRA